MSFFDKYNLLHVEPNQFSENGVLFNSEYSLLSHLIGKKYNSIYLPIINRNTWFDPNPSDNNDENCHFSHDNMTGLYTLYKLQGLDCNELPTIKWNEGHWLHPRDIIYYSILKEKKWTYLLVLLLGLFSCITCLKTRQITSGKCLWWLRWHTMKYLHSSKFIRFSAHCMLKLNEHMLRKEHGEEVWKDIFSIYFKNPEHPINKLMEKSYAKF